MVPLLVAGFLIAVGACREDDDAGADSTWSDTPSDAGAAATKAKSAAAPQTGEDAPNLLIITIDTLRVDHLGCYGYFRNTTPNIDKLAKESVVFDHCLAPMAQTLPAHMSIFTGVYPREHGIVANLSQTRDPTRRGLDGKPLRMLYQPSPILKTFATVVGGAGYTTAAFVSAEPVKREGGLAEGFQTWNEPEGRRRSAEGTNESFFAWLDEDLKQPFMVWIHYFDPHTSYDPPPPYDTMFQSDERLDVYMNEHGIEVFAQERATNRSAVPKGKKPSTRGRASTCTTVRSLIPTSTSASFLTAFARRDCGIERRSWSPLITGRGLASTTSPDMATSGVNS